MVDLNPSINYGKEGINGSLPQDPEVLVRYLLGDRPALCSRGWKTSGDMDK